MPDPAALRLAQHLCRAFPRTPVVVKPHPDGTMEVTWLPAPHAARSFRTVRADRQHASFSTRLPPVQAHRLAQAMKARFPAICLSARPVGDLVDLIGDEAALRCLQM